MEWPYIECVNILKNGEMKHFLQQIVMADFQEYINQIITLHLQLLCQKLQQCQNSHNTIFPSLFSHRLNYNHYRHGLACDSAEKAVYYFHFKIMEEYLNNNLYNIYLQI